MSFFQSVWQDLLSLAILLFFFVWIYAAKSGKSFKDIFNDLKGWVDNDE